LGETLAIYTKPHLSYSEQVDLLIRCGLRIGDSAQAEQLLSQIGYYRLSGYWYPFRLPATPVRRDTFQPGTTLDQVVALYDFDRQLKLLILDAVERVEIAMRVRVGHTLGKRDAHAHLDPRHLDPQFSRAGRAGRESDHAQWLARVLKEQKRSKEEFVQHFRDHYDDRLPVWVITEIMDFGSLSHLYKWAQRPDRDGIALELMIRDVQGHGNGAALINWLQVINHLRNVCAHHSRLWNRNMTVQVAPRQLRSIPELAHVGAAGPAHDRVYSSLCVLVCLMRQVAPNSGWRTHLQELLVAGLAPTGRSVSEMGFPDGWTTQSLWNAGN
jgi:abortive infection bacteriophage resistance protein